MGLGIRYKGYIAQAREPIGIWVSDTRNVGWHSGECMSITYNFA